MKTIGYAFLRDHLALSAFPVSCPARISPVQRVLSTPDGILQTPKDVAPKTDNPLDHVLFALKHEGTNLQVLAETMAHIPAEQLIGRLRNTPNSLLVRKACYLWEQFTGHQLSDIPAIGGSYGDLFDPDRYITAPAQKNSKWRINFNGIGSIDYCPSVERTASIQRGIASDILGRTKAFLNEIGAVTADRALAWAYLSETEHSFAIEHETPSQNKADAFVALLQQAHEARELSEDYLVELQSATIANPFNQAASFRHEQNWLRSGGLRGAGSVSYVPPSPGLLADLMPQFLRLANTAPKQIDPIVAASIASFALVYLHPFMDGNGRLSRFLFHHALCQSGQLEHGLLLPVSVAMKLNENAYLSALQSFSKPARAQWNVRWIDENQFDFAFKGKHSIYRYWDATPGVEFGFRMAEQSLDVHLRQETAYLAQFDRIYKATNAEFDIRNNDLHMMIVAALQNGGAISTNRRKQLATRVPQESFAFVEKLAKTELQALNTR